LTSTPRLHRRGRVGDRRIYWSLHLNGDRRSARIASLRSTRRRRNSRKAGKSGRLGQRWKRCHSEYGPLAQAEWSVFLLVPRPQIARRGPRSMGRALAPQAQGSAKSRRNTHTDPGRGKVSSSAFSHRGGRHGDVWRDPANAIHAGQNEGSVAGQAGPKAS
jgi:hypothetical protein